MYTNGHCDWLSATFPSGTNPKYVLPDKFCQHPPKPGGRSLYGYKTRLEDDRGVVIMMDGTKRMGVHLVLSGSALAELRAGGLTDRGLCQHVLAKDGKVSRIDLAIDLHDGNLEVGHVWQAYLQGALKTPASTVSHIELANMPDETVYIGARISDRFLRVYNKAAKEGIPGCWVRVELESKNEKARVLVRAIAEQPNTRAVINKAIGKFALIPGNPDWEAMLADNSADIEPVRRKLTDHVAWVLDVVVPAMFRYEVEHPGTDMAGLVMSEIARLRSRAVQSGGVQTGQ